MIASATARTLIESHRQWWSLAGLDVITGDQPSSWLARSDRVDTVSQPTAPHESERRPTLPEVSAPVKRDKVETVTLALPPLAMPEDWDGFQNWLATDAAVPGAGWHHHRILPQGKAGARLMLFSLCPEIEEQSNGALHCGEAGRQLDAILRSIGLARDDCYLASLAVTRPPGGRLSNQEMAALTPLMWHHLRIARPERLLVFGTDLTRLIANRDVVEARGRLLDINQNGVKVEAAATQHPLLLLDRPTRKAAAWDSIKRLAQG